MGTEADYRRLAWRSRRGMLELDLLLAPFVRDVYPGLDSAEQARYRKLLRREDRELYSWLLGRVTPRDEDLARIVALVLAHARAAD